MSYDNASLMRRWLDEVWNRRRVETVDELLLDESRCHSSTGILTGKAEFLERQYTPLVSAFPDLKLEIHDVVADGDRVVARWSAGGTHTGEGLPVPPTGRTARIDGMTMVRFRDGKMIEGWDYWDRAQLFEALGVPAAM